MRFQDLLYTGSDISIENKQRLNLSQHAYSVLINDIAVFQPENSLKRGSGQITSNIVNRVFRTFRQTADSSIFASYQRYIQHIKSLLDDIEEGERSHIAALIAADYLRKLQCESLKRQEEKAYPFSFRIDKVNIDYLASQEGQNEGPFYQDKVGSYFKALIEEYAEQPYAEREQIYFSDVVDTIEAAVLYKRLLKITLHSGHTDNGARKNNLMYVKAIGIRQDAERMYNYLVGYTSTNRDGPWEMMPVRLTSIKSCEKEKQTVFISNEERRHIEEEIRRKGVQYISSSAGTKKIVVQFTSYGEHLYQRMLHLRPIFIAKRDDRIYEFNCAQNQAEFYFFKFGQDVRILEPYTLAAKFKQKYVSASEVYANIDYPES